MLRRDVRVARGVGDAAPLPPPPWPAKRSSAGSAAARFIAARNAAAAGVPACGLLAPLVAQCCPFTSLQPPFACGGCKPEPEAAVGLYTYTPSVDLLICCRRKYCIGAFRDPDSPQVEEHARLTAHGHHSHAALRRLPIAASRPPPADEPVAALLLSVYYNLLYPTIKPAYNSPLNNCARPTHQLMSRWIDWSASSKSGSAATSICGGCGGLDQGVVNADVSY